MSKYIKTSIQVSTVFLIGVAYGVLAESTTLLITDNEFLLTFVGVILGIATTIITFIFSSIDKIWDIIDKNNSAESSQSAAIKRMFKSGYTELIEDSKFIFVIFILLFVLVFWEHIDIPYIALADGVSKSTVICCIKIGLFLNCIIAMIDLFFSLINLLKLALYDDSTNE